MSRTYNTDPYQVQMLRKLGRRRTRVELHHSRTGLRGTGRSYYPQDMYFLSLTDDERALHRMYMHGPSIPECGGRWNGMADLRRQLNRTRRHRDNAVVRGGDDSRIERRRRDVRWLWD